MNTQYDKLKKRLEKATNKMLQLQLDAGYSPYLFEKYHRKCKQVNALKREFKKLQLKLDL